jgi:hypothetical protein
MIAGVAGQERQRMLLFLLVEFFLLAELVTELVAGFVVELVVELLYKFFP